MVAALLAGCGGGVGEVRVAGGEVDREPPLVVMRDEQARIGRRVEAVDRAWDEVELGRADRAATREQFKAILWKSSTTNTPPALRLKVVEVLLRDGSEAGIADTRNVMRLRLPTETDWEVIGRIGEAAAERGWTELTPALVRSYARPTPARPDEERPERAALVRLHPGRTVEEVVYRVFAAPDVAATDPAQVDRIRREAWELLSRLDPDGSTRRDFLAAEAGDGPTDRTHAALRAAARELRAVPLTSSELEWVELMRDGGDAAGEAWWRGAAGAIASLSEEQARGLAIRHAEPVRWAALYRTEWLSMDRAALLEALSTRLAGRKVHEREAEAGSAFGDRRERLRDNADRLVWGDVLAILVIDEAMKDPIVVQSLFEQTEIDRRDGSTEHGGSLEAVAGAETPRFRAVHYPPRPAQRVNDTTFVASAEMFKGSVRGLAHYHFHVQTRRNALYAGPGPGDLEYADKHGRNCLVFTSLDEDTLNVDYYQRGGAVVDLGTIRR